MIKIIGFTILGISCLLFILIPIIPLLGFSKATMIWASSAFFISGEVLFYLSTFILGKSYWAKIKNRLIFWKSKPQTAAALDEKSNH